MGLVVQSSIDPLALLDGLSMPALAGEAADGDVFTSLLSSLLDESNAVPGTGAPASASPAATATPGGGLPLEPTDEEPGKRPANDWAAAIALAFVPSPVITPAPSVDRSVSNSGGRPAEAALEPAAGSQAPLGAGPAATAISLNASATPAAPAATSAQATSAPLAAAAASPATTESDTEIPLDWVPQPQTSGDQDPVDVPVVPLSTVGIGSGEQPALEVLHPELFQAHIPATSAWETTPDTEPAEVPQLSAPPPNTENVVTPDPAPAAEPAPADAPPVDDSTPATPSPQGPPSTEAELAANPNQPREASTTAAVVPAMEARPPRVRSKANVEHQLAERERANAVRGLTVGDAPQTPGVVRFAGNTETAPANLATKTTPNASNIARERVAETPAVSHSAVTAGMPANRGIESAPAAPAEAPSGPAPTHAELPAAVHQVSRAIIERAEAGGGEARLHLDPAGLGEVTIHIETRGDEVHVDIQAERPEAMHLLRDHAVDLSSLLGERGLSLTDVSVGSQQRHAAGEGLFRDSRRNRRDNDNFAALLGIEEGPSTERHNRLRSAYNPDGALSYRV